MDNMTITPYSRNIFYYETDRMNVVHHSNYIRWMEESRIDFLKKAGIPYDSIEAMGLMIPVLEVQCRYKHAVTYGDYFVVYPLIAEYNGFRMKITYKMYNKDNGKLCAEAESLHCFTDSSMKPVHINKSHPELHEAFIQAMNITVEE